MTSTDTLGRRERKKLETRRALRQAALRLVAERGLAGVTVTDIADAVDVSTRTFFNHFPCKEDALVGTDAHRLEVLRSALAAEPDGTEPLEVLRVVLLRIVDLFDARRDEMLQQMAIVRDNPELRIREMAGYAIYERELVADVARRSGTDPERDIYPLLAARAVVAALRAALTVWRADTHTPPARSLRDLATEALELLARGLPPPLP